MVRGVVEAEGPRPDAGQPLVRFRFECGFEGPRATSQLGDGRREHVPSHCFPFCSGLQRTGRGPPTRGRQAAVPRPPFTVALIPSQTHLEEFRQIPGLGTAWPSQVGKYN